MEGRLILDQAIEVRILAGELPGAGVTLNYQLGAFTGSSTLGRTDATEGSVTGGWLVTTGRKAAGRKRPGPGFDSRQLHTCSPSPNGRRHSLEEADSVGSNPMVSTSSQI